MTPPLKPSEVYLEWVKYSSWYSAAHRKDFFEMAYLISGLAGEAGEASDEWKKIQRSVDFGNPVTLGVTFNQSINDRLVKLMDEVGDVLWYVAAICNMMNITFDDLMLFNMAKLHQKHGSNTKMPAWPLNKDFFDPNDVRYFVFMKASDAMINPNTLNGETYRADSK